MTSDQLRKAAGLTVDQFESQVRAMIDATGWKSVKADSVLGPIVKARLRESTEYVNACVDIG